MNQELKSMGFTMSAPGEKISALDETTLPKPVTAIQEKRPGLIHILYLRLCELVIAVPGFFKQDKSNANPDKIGPAPDRFGLIDSHKHYWTTFDKKIQKLNKKSDKDTSYKVLFLGRHGEGFRERLSLLNDIWNTDNQGSDNVGMDYYGEDEWDRKWGRKNGNGTMTWGPDAQLTDKGVYQAERVHSLWQQELKRGGGIPLPTAFFVSPLVRALHTFQITFAGVVDDPQPLIIENLRDSYGLRTADLRHNKTWIQEQYPTYKFEDGFTEQDELWMKDERETDEHTEKRVKGVLDKIFKIDDTYLAIVAHSKVVEATFNITKHQDFDVPTGGVVPIVLKIVRNTI